MNVNLTKNAKILAEYFRLHILTLLEYRINFIFDTIVRFFEFAVFFFFWKTILFQNITIPGWDLGGLIVLFSFQQIFLALFLTIALAPWRFEKKIMNGELDKFLARPCTPWLNLIAEDFNLSLGGWITGIGGLLIAQFGLGISIFTPKLLMALFVILIAAAITLFFGLILSSFALWGNRLHLYDYLIDGLFEFDSYPITLFPGYIHTLTSFTIPFLYANTLPALLTLNQLSIETVFPYAIIEIGILLVNYSIFQFIWRKGVKRYEAYGG